MAKASKGQCQCEDVRPFVVKKGGGVMRQLIFPLSFSPFLLALRNSNLSHLHHTALWNVLSNSSIDNTLYQKFSANPIKVTPIWKRQFANRNPQQIPLLQHPFLNEAKPHYLCRAFWAFSLNVVLLLHHPFQLLQRKNKLNQYFSYCFNMDCQNHIQ